MDNVTGDFISTKANITVKVFFDGNQSGQQPTGCHILQAFRLDAFVSKPYEDWVADRINETNFTRMMEKAQGNDSSAH